MAGEDLGLFPYTRVLVAERDETAARRMADILEGVGHTVLIATGGEQALRCIRAEDPELALLAVDVPRLNAYQLCERIKTHAFSRSIPVILLVSPGAEEEKTRGLEVGADDFLNRPVEPLELLARVKNLVKIKRLTDQVETTEKVIYSIAQLLEGKVSSARSDAKRLSDHAVLLGQALGLSAQDLDTLRNGAVLHDIGKIVVREEVLSKSGRLSPEEYDEVKLHPEVGERLCGPLRCADDVLPIIRYHQERWDGNGYPDGLRGEQIPLLARVMAVANAYDAMLSPRPHRPALTPEQAQQSLAEGAGKQWDPELVSAFLRALRQHHHAMA